MALKTGMKILIVDDMFTMRAIIKNMLQKMGLTNIFEADDGFTALPLVQQPLDLNRPFEFIISDWNMSKMNGLDLLKSLRSNEATKKLPFLMVIAEAEQSNVAQAVQAGVSNYVSKPFTEQDFREKIEKILIS